MYSSYREFCCCCCSVKEAVLADLWVCCEEDTFSFGKLLWRYCLDWLSLFSCNWNCCCCCWKWLLWNWSNCSCCCCWICCNWSCCWYCCCWNCWYCCCWNWCTSLNCCCCCCWTVLTDVLCKVLEAVLLEKLLWEDAWWNAECSALSFIKLNQF